MPQPASSESLEVIAGKTAAQAGSAARPHLEVRCDLARRKPAAVQRPLGVGGRRNRCELLQQGSRGNGAAERYVSRTAVETRMTKALELTDRGAGPTSSSMPTSLPSPGAPTLAHTPLPQALPMTHHVNKSARVPVHKHMLHRPVLLALAAHILCNLRIPVVRRLPAARARVGVGRHVREGLGGLNCRSTARAGLITCRTGPAALGPWLM